MLWGIHLIAMDVLEIAHGHWLRKTYLHLTITAAGNMINFTGVLDWQLSYAGKIQKRNRHGGSDFSLPL